LLNLDNNFQFDCEDGSFNWGNRVVRGCRDRRLVHSGCKSHPGIGSFRPVAIGAAVEVTKPLKPPVEAKGTEGDTGSPNGDCSWINWQLARDRSGRLGWRRGL